VDFDGVAWFSWCLAGILCLCNERARVGPVVFNDVETSYDILFLHDTVTVTITLRSALYTISF
jgi:hypothetical protein